MPATSSTPTPQQPVFNFGNTPRTTAAASDDSDTDENVDVNTLDGTQLKLLAEKMGIKVKGSGWAKCCPPDGKKDAIATAIRARQRLMEEESSPPPICVQQVPAAAGDLPADHLAMVIGNMRITIGPNK